MINSIFSYRSRFKYPAVIFFAIIFIGICLALRMVARAFQNFNNRTLHIMTDKKENTEWDNREVGALWVNAKSRRATNTSLGHIKVGDTKEKVIVFKNKFKEENEKAPDFRVYKQKELGTDGSSPAPQKEKEEEDVDLI